MRVEDSLLFVTEVEPLPLPFSREWSGEYRVVAARLGSQMQEPGRAGILTRTVIERDANGVEVKSRSFPVAKVEFVVHVDDPDDAPELFDRVTLTLEAHKRTEAET